MSETEFLIRAGRPPHPTAYRRIGLLLSRFCLKVTLFLVIFFLSFHLLSFTPGPWYLTSDYQARERTIREIMVILEKHPTGLAYVTREELAEFIFEEATRYNHDPKFILALISSESSFKNWSVSERGAKGLMQIMPYVAQSLAQELGIEWMGDRTLFNPFLNVRMGIYYFTRLIFDFHNLEQALVAYNYGPTYVKSLIESKKPIPPEYYKKVLTAYESL